MANTQCSDKSFHTDPCRTNSTPFQYILPLMAFGLWLSSHVFADEQLFRDRVAPILQRRCLVCHNDSDRKGALSLESQESLQRGGESGEPIIKAGVPDRSVLFDQINPRKGKANMPKGADPLSSEEIATIREWIEKGGNWPGNFRIQPQKLSDTNWWSLQPIGVPTPVALSKSSREWAATPVDTYIAQAHEALRLRPAAEADRRTQFRRVYFDLIGLPPSADEVDQYIADPDPSSFDRLLDRLLASPHYGERWGRHWLDVVHFGESHGYDKDKPRPNAWPYRDYVVRTFNTDKPFHQFAQEQIAGDVLFPHTADGIEALGFIAAGPWDFIGHVEVPESKIDGKIARHLDRDDMVSNAMNSFCSLTVQCAQCHDHKFDPISQEDYYSLQAVFAGVDRADKQYDLDPFVSEQRTLFNRLLDLRRSERQLLDQQLLRFVPEIADLDRQIAAAKSSKRTVPPEHGYHSSVESMPDREKWVQVDLGERTAISRLEFIACHDDFNGIGAGFGFPHRYRIQAADDEQFATNVQLLVDRTQDDVPNPGVTPQLIELSSQGARYVRFTATRLAHRKDDYIFALSELKVLNSSGTNVAAGKVVTALDSIEAPSRWSKKNLVDGMFPSAATPAEKLAELEAQRSALIARQVPEEIRKLLSDSAGATEQVQRALQQLPAAKVVFAGTVHSGTGNFTGTGPSGGRPREIRVLARGDVLQPKHPTTPGAIECVVGLPSRFRTDMDSEGARRAQLAKWLSHEKNPLTWRSIVNRVWLYHFGRGIVDTPNDFGRMGEPPSHPELLDWLAHEILSNGSSLKRLHREILCSSTYRQSSQVAPEAAKQDSDNRHYARMNRRRIEAEVVRDSILSAAGKLRNEFGGPSFQDFVVEKPEHSPHYEYHLHDPLDIKSHRRSVYRFLVRSQTQPFMTTWDCADPSMLVDKRNSSITPLQALALLNNQLSVAMSRCMSEQIELEAAGLEHHVVQAFRRTLSRSPTEDELSIILDFSRKHGLANACRLLINTNEFVFID